MTIRSGKCSGYVVDCFGCGTWLPIKMSKKGRAYWICNACAIQVFLRGVKEEQLEEQRFEFWIKQEA
jgi:hypothetical protein